jgi:RNA polymerase sigma-70 factor (ECF subfamily)
MSMTVPPIDRLVQEHERMVRALAMAYCRDENAADDIVQETFWRAWRSLNGLQDPSKVKTWLYALARNAAIDYVRSRRRRKTEALTVDVEAPERSPGDSSDRVMRAVDGLRGDYRQIVLLHYIEKLSYAQIGEALGMTPSAVGEKLHRVRKMVQQRFSL